jgi:M6 family metalloprotease-like protein
MKKLLTIFVGLVMTFGIATPVPAAPKYLDAAPYSKPLYKVGQACPGSTYRWPVVGYLSDGSVGFVECRKSVIKKSQQLFKIDKATLKPLIPAVVSAKSKMMQTSMTYLLPAPSSDSPKTTISDANLFADLTSCKISEADSTGRPHMVSGFGIPAERAKFDDELVVQVVPVEFLDTATKTDPNNDLSNATSAISDFYSRQSDGRAKVRFKIPTSYLKMPKKVSEYNLSSKFPNFNGKAYANYVQEVSAQADVKIDFSDADVVIIAHSPKVTAAQIGTFIAEAGMPGSPFQFKTSEKTILNVMIEGGDNPRDLQNWVHEFGHMLGMTDSGNEGNMAFDIMLWYGVPELTVWNRWIMGFENDSQINCVTSANKSIHHINPVAEPGTGTEGVVIPFSDNKVIVVESRRRTGYDVMLGKESEGALVYAVDTSKSGNGGSGPFKALGPKRMKSGQWINFDAPLKAGETLTFEGWKITNLESGKFGDVVAIEKVAK